MNNTYGRIVSSTQNHGTYTAHPEVFENIASTFPPHLYDALIVAVMAHAGHGDQAYWSDLSWAELCVVLGEVAAADFGQPTEEVRSESERGVIRQAAAEPVTLDVTRRTQPDTRVTMRVDLDWRYLIEDVSTHTMLRSDSHQDGRQCAFHSRLGVWTFDGDKECLRTHRSIIGAGGSGTL